MWCGSRRLHALDVVGEGERQRVADRHRVTAAVDDDSGQGVLPDLGVVGLDGRETEERRAQEPAGTVDTHDARWLHRLGAVRHHDLHLADQLDAPATLALGGRTAVLRDVGRDLGPDLAPEVAAPGRREGP